MIDKSRFKYIGKLIKLAFSKYKILYFLAVISFASIILETIAMSFLSSLSGRKFIIFNNFLKNINQNLIFIWVIILFIVRFIFMFYLENKYTYIARKIQVLLSTQTLEKIFKEKIKTIEKKEIGYFISMAGDEASRSSEIVNSFLKMVNSFLTGILFFIMILYFDFNIIYILTIFFLINFLVIKKSLRKVVSMGNQSLIMSRSNNTFFVDSLNSLRTIKSFGINDFIQNIYFQSMEKYQFNNYKISSYSLFNKLFPLISLFILFDFYVIYDYFGDKRLSIIYLLTMFFMMMRLFTIIGELFHTGSGILSNLKLTQDIITFSKNVEITKANEVVDEIKFIRLENISFGHDKNGLIFKNLNLIFEKGKSYLITGKTGSGKSTLLDLIMDFNTPSTGHIFINDKSSKKIDEKCFTNKILYVSQESMIFNNSVRYNIEIDKSYSIEKLNYFLEIAQLSKTIESFHNGIDHMLNYRGTNISGGQKQRLNLVRALIREPEVLILDESVNALDSETRKKVIKNIKIEYKDKILIIVSHDKDILDLIDEVINLDLINA